MIDIIPDIWYDGKMTILIKFVPLDEAKKSLSTDRFAGCFYVPTMYEYTETGALIVEGAGGMWSWYLHDDMQLHTSAFEDDGNGNLITNGYFKDYQTAMDAIYEYYDVHNELAAYEAQFGAPKVPQQTAVQSQPLFDD